MINALREDAARLPTFLFAAQCPRTPMSPNNEPDSRKILRASDWR